MTALTAEVRIQDGVATTRLQQVWRNDGLREAESTWLLPLEPGAVADGFTLTVNGVSTAGEVLAADQARAVYESIVRQRRDPGLLEYFGRGCLRARIFPIPPGGEMRADVTFRQVLPELAGLRRWSLALGAAGAEGAKPENLVLDLRLNSRKPIQNAYAPLAAIQVLQKDEHEVRASFEGRPAQLADRELALYYALTEAEFGLDLLTHRPEGAAEGTFLMLVSPKRTWLSTEVLKKSITFVLDTSGSMEGPKMAQAKSALKLFLQSLTPDDHFEIVPFATEPEPFFGQRVPATGERVAEALARVERLTAAGGTNIHDALQVAVLAGQSEPGRLAIVVFLTDGEPTVGVTLPDEIRTRVRAANTANARIFALGVGANLNTSLLDLLASDNGGARDYVRAEERIDEKTRALFAKLSHPVMTDLQLTIDGLMPTKLAPAKLPDLFAGDRIELFGRYADSGARAIRLSGIVGGVRREYVYEGTFPASTDGAHAFLAPLWAERRVGQLLDALRLNSANGANAELVAEVERLGREYRIVTPYTSHLVVEPAFRSRFGGGRPSGGAPGIPATEGAPRDELDALGYGGASAEERHTSVARQLVAQGVLPAGTPEAELEQLAARVVRELQDSDEALHTLGVNSTGARAVDDSQYLARLMDGRAAGESGSVFDLFTRRVHDKTFVLRAGLWLDQAVGEAPPVERQRVEAFSGAYFALLAAKPALAPYLAFSSRLVVQLGAEVFEIYEPAAPPAVR